MRPSYDDQAGIAAQVAAGRHRDLVGGLWDEIGCLQFEFLVARGLMPHHRLVDMGCGALRAGVHLVRYLEPGHYFGTDLNASLLEAGYEMELRPAGLAERLPRSNLVVDGSFDFGWAGPNRFDFALAQSVFTHLPMNDLRVALAKLTPAMAPGGRLFVTLFLVPDEHPFDSAFRHASGTVSRPNADPFHYWRADIDHLLQRTLWAVEWLGDWNHPRNQTMLILHLRD